MARLSATKRILALLQSHVGQEVPRDHIREEAGISEWARRIRELSQAGWEIETTQTGYTLQSLKQNKSNVGRVNVSNKQRYRILNRDSSICRRCGRGIDDGIKLVIDHVVPVDWGGSSDDENLWTLCEECNAGKKAFQSDADADAMKAIFGLDGSRNRLKAYLEFKQGQKCLMEEVRIVAKTAQYARRIRELRAAGMDIEAFPDGSYIYHGSKS